MKLALLSPYPPAGGGIAAYARRIGDGLRKNQVELQVVPLNRLSDLLRILPALRRFRPDAVRLEYSIAMYGPGLALLHPILWLIPRLVGGALVVTYHEPVREMARLGLPGRLFYRLISKQFDRVYIHTEEAREALVQQARLPPEKICVMPFGTFDFPDREDAEAEIEEHFQLRQRDVVLFFGFIHIVKGIDHFIEAAHQVFRARPELRGKLCFLIAGSIRRRSGLMRFFERQDRAYYDRLLAMRRDFELEDEVSFVGYVEDRLLCSLIERAKVVVVPYVTAEQSSLLMMAIPLGRPTVATDLGGHRELLEDVGGLVPVGRPDAMAREILRLLEDPGYYASIVDAYRELEARLNTVAGTRVFVDDLKHLVERRRHDDR